MRIKVKTTLGDIAKAGETITTPDVGGVPTSQYWRRRLKESEIDGCCEVVKESKSKPSSKEKAPDKSPKLSRGEG